MRGAKQGAGLVRRLPAVAWLLTVWVALWGELSIANLLGGLAVAGVIHLAFPHSGPRPAGPVRPLPALRFLASFAYQLVRATIAVAVEVLRLGTRIQEGIVAIQLRGVSDAVATVVANAISLTPGTLTLEVEVDRDVAVLYVHCLRVHDVEQQRRDLEHLGELAVAAFGRRAPGGRDEMARIQG